MNREDYILVLWRVDDIPCRNLTEELDGGLHNPRLLAISEVVDAVELHALQDPIKLIDESNFIKSKVKSLLIKHNSNTGRANIVKLDADNARTIALDGRNQYNNICVSALTRLFKPLTGGLDREFERQIIKMLKKRTVFELDSLAEDIEAKDELQQADCSGKGKKKTDTRPTPTSEDNKRIKQIKEYIKDGEFKKVDNQYVDDTGHFKKAAGSLMSAISKSKSSKTCYDQIHENYLIGITKYREKKYYWVQLQCKKRGAYWYLKLN